MVAIHATPPAVDLFRVFWRELTLIGARVYERSDYEEAVRLLAAGAIPADTLITDVDAAGPRDRSVPRDGRRGVDEDPHRLWGAE